MNRQFYEMNLNLAKRFRECSDEQSSIIETFIRENEHIFPFIAKNLSYKNSCDYEDALSIVKVCALKVFASPSAYRFLKGQTFWRVVENDAKEMLHKETRSEEGSYSTIKLRQRQSKSFVKKPVQLSIDGAAYSLDNKETYLRDTEKVQNCIQNAAVPSLEETFIKSYLKNVLENAVDLIGDDKVKNALLYSYKDYPYDDVSERTYYRKRRIAAGRAKAYLTLKGLDFADFCEY